MGEKALEAIVAERLTLWRERLRASKPLPEATFPRLNDRPPADTPMAAAHHHDRNCRESAR